MPFFHRSLQAHVPHPSPFQFSSHSETQPIPEQQSPASCIALFWLRVLLQLPTWHEQLQVRLIVDRILQTLATTQAPTLSAINTIQVRWSTQRSFFAFLRRRPSSFVLVLFLILFLLLFLVLFLSHLSFIFFTSCAIGSLPSFQTTASEGGRKGYADDR